MVGKGLENLKLIVLATTGDVDKSRKNPAKKRTLVFVMRFMAMPPKMWL